MVPIEARDDFSLTIGADGATLRVPARRAACSAWCSKAWLTAILLSVGRACRWRCCSASSPASSPFIPNIGAFISGVLMISVGFSAGSRSGLWAIVVYFGVQTFDGYVLIPLVAKKTVDLPPALTLSAQILASTLFGFWGWRLPIRSSR